MDAEGKIGFNPVRRCLLEVVGIYIAARKGESPQPVDTVRAFEARGLDGDRYAADHDTVPRGEMPPRRQLSIIMAESLDALRDQHGIDLHPGAHRRNIVVRGVDLMALADRPFRIGTIAMVGAGPCAPCQYLERKTVPGVLAALQAVGGAGIRAEIHSNGTIHVGDAITIAG